MGNYDAEVLMRDNWYSEWDGEKTYHPGNEVVVLTDGHGGYPIPVTYRCKQQNKGVHPHYRKAEHQETWMLI